ncbi:MAG: hypothetical protein ACRC5M_00440 [Anaeroplasmataceae bacterium]
METHFVVKTIELTEVVTKLKTISHDYINNTDIDVNNLYNICCGLIDKYEAVLRVYNTPNSNKFGVIFHSYHGVIGQLFEYALTIKYHINNMSLTDDDEALYKRAKYTNDSFCRRIFRSMISFKEETSNSETDITFLEYVKYMEFVLTFIERLMSNNSGGILDCQAGGDAPDVYEEFKRNFLLLVGHAKNHKDTRFYFDLYVEPIVMNGMVLKILSILEKNKFNKNTLKQIINTIGVLSQYYIPGIYGGSKIRINSNTSILMQVLNTFGSMANDDGLFSLETLLTETNHTILINNIDSYYFNTFNTLQLTDKNNEMTECFALKLMSTIDRVSHKKKTLSANKKLIYTAVGVITGSIMFGTLIAARTTKKTVRRR